MYLVSWIFLEWMKNHNDFRAFAEKFVVVKTKTYDTDRDWETAGGLYADGYSGKEIKTKLDWKSIEPESIERGCRKRGFRKPS